MSLSQKRRAPAFQEYAADMLANTQYRLMSLEEKGLLHVLRNECWVNDRIPSKHDELARYLGLEVERISTCLSSRVMKFFIIENGSLTCPELDSYRASLNEKSNKLSAGGSKGGKRTQENIKNNKASLEATLKPLSRNEESEDEKKLVDLKSVDMNNPKQITDPWVVEYDASPEILTPYLIASRGS